MDGKDVEALDAAIKDCQLAGLPSHDLESACRLKQKMDGFLAELQMSALLQFNFDVEHAVAMYASCALHCACQHDWIWSEVLLAERGL